METVIISAIMNILAWSNVEFIQQKKTNERLYDCEWVDVGWQKTDHKNPSLHIFGYIKYRQHCVDKKQ
jgi:hypothetical protein|tara:strand:+ start:1061 stop:1264 length:204 start_codon:yes stop_codon:yes gene_type:complete